MFELRVPETIVLLVLGLAMYANAEVPQLVNHQGRLVDGASLLNGNIAMELRLYDDPIAGNLLYADSNTVIVVDGLYQTVLGDNTVSGSLFDAITNTQVYLEIQVNGTALLPRERMAAVPYSLRTFGIVVDNAGRIGIGTNQPNATARMTVTADSLNNAIVADSSQLGSPTIHAINPGGTEAYPALWVESASDVTPSGGGAMLVGDPNGPNIGIDSNEIMARNAGGATLLHLNGEGGETRVGGRLAVGTSALSAQLTIRDTNPGADIGIHVTSSVATEPTIYAHNEAAVVGEGNDGLVFHADSVSDVEPGSGGAVVIGQLDDFNLAFDRNEIMARSNGLASGLLLNFDGGDTSIGGDATIFGNLEVLGELQVENDLVVKGNIALGTTNKGEIVLSDALGVETIHLDSSGIGGAGVATLRNSAGNDTLELRGDLDGGSALLMRDAQGSVAISLTGGRTGVGGVGEWRNAAGDRTIQLDAGFPGNSPTVVLGDGAVDTLLLNGSGGGGGAGVTLKNSLGNTTINIDADSSDNAEITLTEQDGSNSIRILGSASDGGGGITMYNSEGVETVFIDGDTADAGIIAIENAAGTRTITLDADAGGSGRVTTEVLEITGGADLSENFDVAGHCEPGFVVRIDPDNPGALRVSSRAYDRTVAGVCSGANGVQPGMLMGQKGSAADGAIPVALSGRVYVFADAGSGAIAPGDLLTTSATEGHVMKVQEYEKAQGAIIGKAMSSLDRGTGHVLMLVSLQ